MNRNEFINSKKLEQKQNDDIKYYEGLKKIIETDEGLEIFRRIMEEAKVFNSCFTGNSTTFYNEGKRDIGLSLMSDLMRADNQAINKIFKLQQDKSLIDRELEQKWIEEFNNE